MTKSTPFDDIRATIRSIPAANSGARKTVEENLSSFAGPQPVIGRWDELVAWLATWQGIASVDKPLIAVFAGTHDVAQHFVDADDIVAQAQKRIASLTGGQAAVRGMCQSLNAAFKIYEMGVDYPVPDITKSPSLSERDCAAAMAYGMEVVAEGADIIVLGNAGLGTATAAAAIARGLYGGSSDYWAGAHDHSAQRRIDAVETATNLHREVIKDPLVCLQYFGGRDIAGMVGAILAARHQSIPVLLDGFISCTAAAVLHAINPDAISHCQAGHLSAEPGHGALLDRLNLTPLHRFGISLGDGTGAAYALGTLRLSVAAYKTLLPKE